MTRKLGVLTTVAAFVAGLEMRHLVAKLTIAMALTSLLAGTTTQASPVSATIEFNNWSAPIRVDGTNTQVDDNLVFQICIDTDTQDNFGPTDFGNFPGVKIRVTIPSLGIENELVTNVKTYFEDITPNRAGISNLSPDSEISVIGDSGGTILDPNVITDPLPSIQGRGLWNSRMVLNLSSGTTLNANADTPTASFISPGTPGACVLGACTSPPAGLVAWWPLDGNGDDMVGGNNGTTTGTASFVAGRVDDAMSVAGNNSSLTVPDDPSLDFGTGDLSIDAWIKTSAGSGVKTIVDKRVLFTTGYVLFLSNGDLSFQLADGASTNFVSGTDVADDDWHLVSVTVDRDQSDGGRLYVDGTLVLTFDPTGRAGSLDNGSDLLIGKRVDNNAGASFNGLIDEVELFNRVLTPAEIQAIFNAGSAGKCKAGLTKELTSGPDADIDGEIDIAIEVKQTTTTPYDFELTYAAAESDPDNVVIIDTIPAEWDVSKIDGVEVPDSNDAPHKGPTPASGVGLGCGESESDLGNDTNVSLERGGKVGKKCSSSTEITWTLTPAEDLQTLKVDVTTRQSPSGKIKYKPTSCGKLTINDGAQAFEADENGDLVLRLGGVPGGDIDPINGEPVPVGDPSNSLMLVAVKDIDGGGIVPDGSGDEDGDGLTDADEAFIHETNPCDPDSDGDGLSDGAEVNTHGTDPNDSDSDGDGFSDGVEVGAGTDPLDDQDFPT